MALNPAAMTQLRNMLDRKLGLAADAYAEGLQEKLSRAGSGIHHAGAPNRSSTADEYPARQTGALAGSIGAKRSKAKRLQWEVGSFNGPPEALYLVLRPPSQGGRDWATRALHDPVLHRLALAAMRGGVK